MNKRGMDGFSNIMPMGDEDGLNPGAPESVEQFQALGPRDSKDPFHAVLSQDFCYDFRPGQSSLLVWSY